MLPTPRGARLGYAHVANFQQPTLGPPQKTTHAPTTLSAAPPHIPLPLPPPLAQPITNPTVTGGLNEIWTDDRVSIRSIFDNQLLCDRQSGDTLINNGSLDAVFSKLFGRFQSCLGQGYRPSIAGADFVLQFLCTSATMRQCSRNLGLNIPDVHLGLPDATRGSVNILQKTVFLHVYRHWHVTYT